MTETTKRPSIDLVSTEAKTAADKNPMNDILIRLQKLEAENEELKKNSLAEMVKTRKEKYTGPWMYSYKMIEGKPITNLKTVKNDVKRNYQQGGYNINQIVELTFSDGKTKQMNYDEFSQSYERSPKILVTETREKDGLKYYIFNIDGNTFEVANNIIN